VFNAILINWICDQQLIGQIITHLIQHNVGQGSSTHNNNDKKSNCEIIQILLRLRFDVSIPAFGIIHSFVYPIPLSVYTLPHKLWFVHTFESRSVKKQLHEG